MVQRSALLLACLVLLGLLIRSFVIGDGAVKTVRSAPRVDQSVSAPDLVSLQPEASREPREAASGATTEAESAPVEASAPAHIEVAVARIEDGASALPLDGAFVARYPTVKGALSGTYDWDVIDEAGVDGVVNIPLEDPVADPMDGSSWSRAESLFVFGAPGYGISVASLTAEHVTPKPPRRVRLVRAGSVSGTVSGASDSDGEPIVVEFEAQLSQLLQADLDLAWTRPFLWRQRIDEAGAFAVDGLPSGIALEARVLRAESVIWTSPNRVRLEPGEARRVEWNVGADSTIRVVATEEGGGPAVGVELALDVLRQRGWKYGRGLTDSARKLVTDASGQAVFEDVTIGNWTLIVTGDQPALANSGATPEEIAARSPCNALFEVDVEAAGSTQELAITIHRGHTIEGRVVDADGVPVSGSVSARSDELGFVLASYANDGRFRLGPMLPGEYEVNGSPLNSGMLIDSKTVMARTGARDVLIQLGLGATLEGRIVDGGTGEPLSASTTYVPSGRVGGYTTTPAEPGLLRIHSIHPGPFFLVIKTTDGRMAIHEDAGLQPGTSQEDVRVEVGGRTQLEVHYGGSVPSVLVVVEKDGVHLGQERVTAASPALLAAVPGRLSVEACVRAKDHSWTSISKVDVTVSEGDTLRVDLE